MSETEATTTTDLTTDRLNGVETDPNIEAKQRSKDCGAALEEVLAKFNCRIRAWPVPENVGDGSKVLLSATWNVFPEAVEE